MALYIIDGKPGSGKTYYAVYHLLKKYYKNIDGNYVLDLKKNAVVITNIEDFYKNQEFFDFLEKKIKHG